MYTVFASFYYLDISPYVKYSTLFPRTLNHTYVGKGRFIMFLEMRSNQLDCCTDYLVFNIIALLPGK